MKNIFLFLFLSSITSLFSQLETDTLSIAKIEFYLKDKSLQNLDVLAVNELNNIEINVENEILPFIEIKYIVFPVGLNIIVISESYNDFKKNNIKDKLQEAKIDEKKIVSIQVQILYKGNLNNVINLNTDNFISASEYFENFKSYASIGNLELALQSIDKAINMDSLNIDYLNAKGQLYYETKDYYQAKSQFEKVLQLSKNYSSIKYLGYVNSEIGNKDLAIQMLTSAIDMTRDTNELFDIYKKLGEIKLNQFDKNSAYNYFLKAISFNNKDISTLINLSATCEAANKSSEKLSYLNKVLEIDPNYYLAHINIGFYYIKLNEFKKALEEFDAVLLKEPKQAYALSNKAYCLLKLGQLNDALITINQSIESNSNNSYAYRNRGLINIELNDNNTACKDFNTALQLGFSQQYGNEINDLLVKFCN